MGISIAGDNAEGQPIPPKTMIPAPTKRPEHQKRAGLPWLSPKPEQGDGMRHQVSPISDEAVCAILHTGRSALGGALGNLVC